jgi:hypothetical protein
VAREQGVDDLRLNRVLIADDTGKEGFAGAESGNQIRADLVLHAPVRDTVFGVSTAAKVAKGAREFGVQMHVGS